MQGGPTTWALLAERPMYFVFLGWEGGHDVVGYAP
jgi:hypothetical protein